MFANRRNSRVLQEIKIEEYDGDVKFQTRGFRPEVEIRQFLTEKNVQYNPWQNHRNFCALQK